MMQRHALKIAALCLFVSCFYTPATSYGGEDVTKGKPWHHVDITRRGLTKNDRYEGAGFSGRAAGAIARHADDIDSYLYNPVFWTEGVLKRQNLNRLDAALVGFENLSKLHFDDTFSTSGLRANWERYAAGTLAGLYWASMQGASGDLGAGQNILGVSFHAVQDFYSHSNWVDDPERRCKTWFQTSPEQRGGMSVYSGAYELPAAGAPKHHGAYSLSCSLLRGDTMDQLLDPICTGYSPFQNTSLCEEWRVCRGGAAVTMSAFGEQRDDLMFLEPPGIALDTTWLARVQAPNRSLTDQDGNFMPGKDGMHFRPEDCTEIVKATGHSVCDVDADHIFAGSKDLAIRATTEWAQYLEAAMEAMGPRQRMFWGRLTREGSDDAMRARQYEDFAQLPYQFLAAGPYPVANPSSIDREIAGSANGWYLRLRIKTAWSQFAGTDSNIFARVRIGDTDQDILLDYLPTDDKSGRTDSRLLVYNDFEKGDDAVYMLGPFAEQPQSISLVNDSGSNAEIFSALWNDFTHGVEGSLTSARRLLIGLIGGNADYVGTESLHRTSTELKAIFVRPRRRGVFVEEKIHINGGEQGVHDVFYRLRETPGRLTASERRRGWLAVEVQLHKLYTEDESKVDRGTTSDEPFVIFHIAPLNGREDAAHTYLSPQLVDMDSDETHVFPRRTGSSAFVKIPPEGGLVVSAQIYESDSENGFDRRQLMRTFASGFDEGTREPASKFADELGRVIAADWSVDFVEAFAFERGAIPHAGPVLRRRSVGKILGDEASRVYRLNWRRVRPLLSSDNAIGQWEADPVGAEVLDGQWHARGYDCDEEPVAYDAVDIEFDENDLFARKIDGTPCVGADQLSWKGKLKDGIIDGELWTSPSPETLAARAAEAAPVEPEAPPNFLDTTIDPMIALEGNWMIQWEGSDLPPGQAVLSKGIGRSCVDNGSGCWYRFTRNPDASWGVGFWMAPGQGSAGNVSITPAGEISTGYHYFHLGHWGGASTGVANGDTITGEWSYGDNKGREIWTRIRSKVTEAEAMSGETMQRQPINRPLNVTAPYVGPGYYMRGNRPTIYLNLYGENLWGLHYYFLAKQTDLEISGLSYICVNENGNGYPAHSTYGVCMDQGGVLGVTLSINVWPNAKPGKHTLLFNDQKIDFNLDITGYPEPNPRDEPGWRPLKLEMGSCSTLREIDPPEGVTGLVFTRPDFRRR